VSDRALGTVIFLVSICAIVVYLGWLFYTPTADLNWLFFVPGSQVRWALVLPMLLAVVAVLAICAWIGWTMATTPPPTPIEEKPIASEEKSETKPSS
jgi:predicted DNA-binding transcriptional regulator